MRKDGIDWNKFQSMYTKCTLCPRKCGANRASGETGICKVTSGLRIARAALHMWEEPCISGTKGSGAVFFSGCSLHCVFCQNEEIAQGIVGKDVVPERLIEIFFELQEKGANNINLVTPGQYIPHIIYAVENAKMQGMNLPIIYNTSGYENVDTLKLLEGIVDVYLPDFKYMNPSVSAEYSHALNYPKVVKEAVAEMVRQQPTACFYKEGEPELLSMEAEDGYLIKNGVIVRQLLLPGQQEDAIEIVDYLHKTYGNRIYLSMMSQYTPLKHVENYPELNRKVDRMLYDQYIDHAISIGVEQGFIQEEDVAQESFIPDFDCEGV